VLRPESGLFFANEEAIRQAIRAHAGPGTRTVVLDAETVPTIDITAVARLIALAEELRDRGTELAVSAAEPAARRQAIDRYSIGDRTPRIAYAEDGSLEIALQPAEPTDPVCRANWLPTPAGEPFTVIYRMYGPGEQAQAGAWSLPSIRPAS
jgi:hypothetical protein